MKLRRFSPPISGRGKAREENIKQVMQQYADLLAKECAENPLLWFNFYNFWNDKKMKKHVFAVIILNSKCNSLMSTRWILCGMGITSNTLRWLAVNF